MNKSWFIIEIVFCILSAFFPVGFASAQTLAYWRMDADRDGNLSFANAMKDEYPLRSNGKNIFHSYRRPVRQLPAFSVLPERSRLSLDNQGSFFLSGKDSSYLYVPLFGEILNFKKPFTIEGWFRVPDRVDQPRAIFSVGENKSYWGLMLSKKNERVFLSLRLKPSVQGTKDFETKDFEIVPIVQGREHAWHFVALTYDSLHKDRFSISLDGKISALPLQIPSSLEIPSCSSLFFGALPAGDGLFCGEMDLWRVSDRPLPAAALLYSSRVQTAAFWTLDVTAKNTLELNDRATDRAYPLSIGKDGGVSAVQDSALGIIPNQDPLSDGKILSLPRRGCAQMRGGIGVRSLLCAKGLGPVCEWTRGFTVEGWFKKDGEPDVRRGWYLVGARDDSNGWSLFLSKTPEGKTKFCLFVSDVSSGGSLQFEEFFHNADLTNDHRWHHAALVCDPAFKGQGAWTLYLDGIWRGRILNKGFPSHAHGFPDVYIGGRPSYSNSFIGKVSAWRVSAGPLPAEALLCASPDHPRSSVRPEIQNDKRNAERAATLLPGNQKRNGLTSIALSDNELLSFIFESSTGSDTRSSLFAKRFVSKKLKSSILIDRGIGFSDLSAFRTDFGRIYLFYLSDQKLPSPATAKTDKQALPSATKLMFRYSDDLGRTWSTERIEVPIRGTAIDKKNPWKGAHFRIHNLSRPVVCGKSFVMALTKQGASPVDEGEGWIISSDNLLNEWDPARIHFAQYPEGRHGIRHPEFGAHQINHQLISLPSDKLLCLFSADGLLAYSFSKDCGKHWSIPERVFHDAFEQQGSFYSFPVQIDPKRLLLLQQTEPHEGSSSIGFVRAGIPEADGKIRWTQPEVLYYTHSQFRKMKRINWVHTTRGDQILALTENNELVDLPISHRVNLLWNLLSPGEEKIRRQIQKRILPSDFGHIDHGGFAIAMKLDCRRLPEGGMLFSTMDGMRGVRIARVFTHRNTSVLQIELYDGDLSTSWRLEEEALPASGIGKIVFNFDFRACLMTAVANGVFCNGAKQCNGGQYLPGELGDVTAGSPRIHPSVSGIELFTHPISTAEAIRMTR